MEEAMKRPWLWFIIPTWLRDTLESLVSELATIRIQQERIMGLVEDLTAKVAEVQATVDATQAAVQLAIANLKAEIQSLKDQLAGSTPGDPALEAAVAAALANMETIVQDLQTGTLPAEG
jgi:seryl-tRNA synthetase